MKTILHIASLEDNHHYTALEYAGEINIDCLNVIVENENTDLSALNFTKSVENAPIY